MLFVRAPRASVVFDTLSRPMRSLLSRIAFLFAGAVVGLGLYALDVGGVLVVPLAVVSALVIGELVLFAVGDGL
jgi:hypothetical protein